MTSTKQHIFVEQYALCRNAARAARNAGYSPGSARVTASRLLTKANVRAALAERESELAQDLSITRQSVLKALRAAVDLAEAQGNPQAMIAGWREIAKICGFYSPETKSVALSAEHLALRARFEAMSDEALLSLADRAAAPPSEEG